MDIPIVKTEIPSPLPQHASEPHLPVDGNYLHSLLNRFFDRATEVERADLHAWTKYDLNEEFRVATGCSGTEGPLLVWHAFATIANARFGISVQVTSAFASENNPLKQDFIKALLPGPRPIFRDTSKLGEATGEDVVSGDRLPIPVDAKFAAFGWPCTDVSSENMHSDSSTNRSCVLDGTLSTGSVFKGVVEYAKNHGAELLVLHNENVPRLATLGKGCAIDNLSAACWLLSRECDMFTKVWQLDPRAFGVPVSRPRLHFPSFARKELRKIGLTDEKADKILSDIMVRLVGSELAPVDAYLLDETDPVLHHFMYQHKEHDFTAEQLSAQSSLKWPRKHESTAARSGQSWFHQTYPSEETMRLYRGLRIMQVREIDLVMTKRVTQFPEAQQRFVDAGPSADRAAVVNTGSFPIVRPRSRTYITDRCRTSIGFEHLRLQSICYPNPEKLLEFPDHLLVDLAGNAFELSCYAASTFASCVMLSKGAAERNRHHLGDPDAESEDSGIEGIWGR